MDTQVQDALLQLHNDLLYFQRRAYDTQLEITSLLARAGFPALKIGILQAESPVEQQKERTKT